MNMVEKVAKAIYEKRNGKGCTPWAKRGMAHKEPYFSDARAAIEAMKEPTMVMKAAGQWFQFSDPYVASPPVSDCVAASINATRIWQEMITAALSKESIS